MKSSNKSRQLLRILNIVVLILSAIVFAYGLFERTHTQVVVEWATASELETTGFNLYRSESINGVYARVNPQLIPASPDPLTGGSYTFKDGEVEPGKTYFYELEEFETGGKTNRHGPIEVNAIAGGTSEFILALLLAAVSILGLMSLRSPGEASKNGE